MFRRLFLEYIENKLNPTAESKMNNKVKLWLKDQLILFEKALCSLLAAKEGWAHALATRTLIEVIINHAKISNYS